VGGSSDDLDCRTLMVRWHVEELKVQLKIEAGTELVKDGAYE
jgi:hypothetical protein